MNLHAIVAPQISAINPSVPVKVQVSVGSTSAADSTQKPVYATPGALTASIGGTFTASIPDPINAPTTLSVATVLTGSLQAGDEVSGTDGTNALPADTTILAQLSGSPGGAGTYELSAPAVLNSCTVTSESTVLNVSAVSAGVLQAGQTLADAGPTLLAGTMVTGFISGLNGGAGLYSISQQQTVAAEAMTTSMSIIAQVQPLSASDLTHVDRLNLQGSHRAFWFSSMIRGIVRVALKGGDLLTLPDGSIWLVNQPVEQWSQSGWSHVIGTLQNGG